MVLRFSRAKQRQGNVQKSVLHVKSVSFFLAKVVFLLIRSIVVVFYRSCCLHLLFSIARFFIFFEETINIKESFAFTPG